MPFNLKQVRIWKTEKKMSFNLRKERIWKTEPHMSFNQRKVKILGRKKLKNVGLG